MPIKGEYVDPVMKRVADKPPSYRVVQFDLTWIHDDFRLYGVRWDEEYKRFLVRLKRGADAEVRGGDWLLIREGVADGIDEVIRPWDLKRRFDIVADHG